MKKTASALRWHWIGKGITMSILGALLGLVGCGEARLDELKVGMATEAEVRELLGKPETIWESDQPDDGVVRTLEYPRGPEGLNTYMFDFDVDGRLLAKRQVLTLAQFGKVVVGMSRDDVRKLLGKPRKMENFPLKQEEVWDWKYSEGYQNAFFNVHFNPNGKVVRTSRSEPLVN